MLLALGDIYGRLENRHKMPQLKQDLARDCFQIFAGVQGVRKQVYVDYVGHTDVGVV